MRVVVGLANPIKLVRDERIERSYPPCQRGTLTFEIIPHGWRGGTRTHEMTVYQTVALTNFATLHQIEIHYALRNQSQLNLWRTYPVRW